MISAHCSNAATKPDTLYYVLCKKKKIMSHPLLGKNPNKKPLAEHIFLVSVATGGESEVQPLT